jgi:hypothetical protein
VERVLTSYRFLASTAVCCGLSVAVALWAVGDASGGARALAGLIGLTAALAVMLLIAAAAKETEAEASPVPPVVVPTVEVEPPATPPPVPEGGDALARRLDEGRSLREELAPGSTDLRVDAWLEDVRAAIESWRPGVAGYFNALGGRAYADDAARLDAYTRRLETIVRGY